MASSVYLPTEILVLIVLFVAAEGGRAADDALPPARQRTLHACCLVSRQWYSAAIALLYEKPQLGSGMAFNRFTETVCPPVAARKSKWNLGGFVRRLDLSGLVHHSSNSLTARLLGRVKGNLEVFVAPRVSFASNSLPSLSKCLNLTHLDLSLVSDPIPFPQLKKTIQNLRRLTALRLPRSTFLNNPESRFDWPPRLRILQLSGTFSPATIPSFAWPPRLTSLSLSGCTDLSVTALASLVSSPQLASSLRTLSIAPFNRNLHPESVNAVPAFLPGLLRLSVPGDLVEDSFFDILAHLAPPLALEVLEFAGPVAGAGGGGDGTLEFSTVALLEALDGGLANLRAVGFADVWCTDQRILEDEEVDDVLQKRARPGFEGEAGVYYM
ncbi:F-box domain protein [Aspergillus sp. HF37]|nr:F-box domain protein [Aspergillus sp. HF37]